jgi:hypothetical protein
VPSYVLVPTGDRGPNSATPVPAIGAGSHFVRAATDDNDAGYLNWTTTTPQEYFKVTPDIPDNESVSGVVLSAKVRNSVGGSTIRGHLRKGVDVVVFEEFIDVFGYQTYDSGFQNVDPTGAPWTVDGVAATDIGLNVPGINGQVRLTYMKLTVTTNVVAQPVPSVPFIKLRPQADGFFTDWLGFAGATAAWDCVNDEVSDGDASYVEFNQNREASFRFGGLSNLLPKQIDLFVTARRVGGANFNAEVGFCNRGGGFNASLLRTMSLTSSYVTSGKSFIVHPIRGDAFRPGDLNHLEIFARTPNFTVGTWRASRFEVVVSYDEPSAYRIKSELDGSVVA